MYESIYKLYNNLEDTLLEFGDDHNLLFLTPLVESYFQVKFGWWLFFKTYRSWTYLIQYEFYNYNFTKVMLWDSLTIDE